MLKVFILTFFLAIQVNAATCSQLLDTFLADKGISSSHFPEAVISRYFEGTSDLKPWRLLEGLEYRLSLVRKRAFDWSYPLPLEDIELIRALYSVDPEKLDGNKIFESLGLKRVSAFLKHHPSVVKEIVEKAAAYADPNGILKQARIVEVKSDSRSPEKEEIPTSEGFVPIESVAISRDALSYSRIRLVFKLGEKIKWVEGTLVGFDDPLNPLFIWDYHKDKYLFISQATFKQAQAYILLRRD